MDNASLRRNLPTIHSKWNVNQAILSGDVMAFIANECFLQTPSNKLLKVLRVFNKAAIEVCIGQQLDLDYEKVSVISQDEYLRMIELKTAALIAASVKIGALIGGCDDRESELLYGFGRNLGLAFQIQDDLLDLWGDSKTFGKKSGGDIVANKKAMPLVKAMEKASGEQRKYLQELLNSEGIDPETKVRKVISLFDELNIRDITEVCAFDFINKAFGYIKKITVDEERKKEITNLAISLIGREH